MKSLVCITDIKENLVYGFSTETPEVDLREIGFTKANGNEWYNGNGDTATVYAREVKV